jgi:hypothetical protein
MLTNPGVVLILFVLPDAKNFGNLRTCDNINSGRLSKPVLTDSISQVLETMRYQYAILTQLPTKRLIFRTIEKRRPCARLFNL